ncbi:MAG: ATP-binding cassette domain-containing protein [Anaerolineae bacterium]
MSFIIETNQLTRRYRDFVAVDALDLCVPTGSVYGFLGPNGAGKTTTIRMLLGLITPSAGGIQLFSQPMTAKDRRSALRRVGALVEMPSLYPHLTGRQNLEVTRRLLEVPVNRIDHVLALVKLREVAGKRVREYSLGMKQRLGIALALLGQPDLLILDEPTNGLDPAGIHEVRDLIRTLPGELGITIFLSSHLLSEVEQIATHIGVINKGKLLFQGTLGALQAQHPAELRIGTRQPSAALEWLAKQHWSVESRDKALYVRSVNQADAAHINKGLIQAGLDVFHLTLEQPTLEQIFLQLTQQSGSESAQ